jgi:hypothetical protein
LGPLSEKSKGKDKIVPDAELGPCLADVQDVEI